MTTEADVRASGQGSNPPQPGQGEGRSAEPPAIQINMPKPGPRPEQSDKPRENQPSMDAVEDLLRRLMARLDENERRYGDALQDLNHRLNDLSERASSVPSAGSTGAALDRVREQASSLAAQVSEAGSGRHGESRRSALYGANDDEPLSDLGDPRLNTSFADITERLERALASRAPAGEIDALSRRMDELGRRFDSALARSGDAEALRSIEAQLRALTAGFGEVRRSHARVAAIEDHLSRLMNWAQSGAGGASDGGRLEAIEQTLQALDQNAREMDARTVSTLQAMNEALHSLAANAAGADMAPAARYEEDAEYEPEPAPHEPALRPRTRAAERGGDSEVWFERPGMPDVPREEEDRAAAIEQELGATIPDYQPAPGKPHRASAPRARSRAESPGRVEPAFEAENDFIASARRAAAAAAEGEPRRPQRPAKSLVGRLSRAAAPRAEDDPRKPRRLLYFVAAGLLAMSAALLYARLQTQQPAAVGSVPQHTQPPAAAPKSPAPQDFAPQTPQQKPPAATKQQSERMYEAPPAPAQTPPQAAGTASAETHLGEQTPRPTAVRRPIPADAPISTATVLASLPPDLSREQLPGTSVTIEEPSRTPSPLAHNGARAGIPALVPPTEGDFLGNPMPLPRRAPVQGESRTAKRTPAGEIDSAPANEVDGSAEHEPVNGMPPAGIGPNSLRIAAARGNPAAQVEVGQRYAKGSGMPKDMKKAAQWYHRAAAQGFAPGQYRLAALYERGQGVKQDVSIARTWYRRAAELGNVRAMHNLAVLYTRAEGGAADYNAARNWFQEAARHGLADSQFNLGILYESGLGVTRNIAEAYKWFSLAARQGDTEAQKRREAVRPHLPARSLSAVEQTIRRWKAAEPKEEANASRAPRGGWQNAETGRGGNDTDAALVKRVQALLNRLGYDAGVPDGKTGPQTEAAIRRFQQRTGTPESGEVSHELQRRLESLAS